MRILFMATRSADCIMQSLCQILSSALPFPLKAEPYIFSLAAADGVEPPFSSSEPDVLPMDDTAVFWCAYGDSNPGPTD